MFGVDDPAVAAAVRAYVKLMRAARSVSDRVEARLAPLGLTLTQLGVLEAILHQGPMTHRALCRKVLTSPANLTDVVDRLAARGLTTRVRDAADRRLVHVGLTAPGRALIQAVFPPHAGDIATAMAGLDKAELAQLDRLLRKLGLAAEGELVPAAPGPHLGGEPFDTERPSDREISR